MEDEEEKNNDIIEEDALPDNIVSRLNAIKQANKKGLPPITKIRKLIGDIESIIKILYFIDDTFDIDKIIKLYPKYKVDPQIAILKPELVLTVENIEIIVDKTTPLELDEVGRVVTVQNSIPISAIFSTRSFKYTDYFINTIHVNWVHVNEAYRGQK